MLEDLDPVYFAKQPWAARLKAWLERYVGARTFLSANAEAVDDIAKRRDLGLRMAVNIPAHALVLFLKDGRYKNAYERQPDAGQDHGPSKTRRRVDEALFPAPSHA